METNPSTSPKYILIAPEGKQDLIQKVLQAQPRLYAVKIDRDGSVMEWTHHIVLELVTKYAPRDSNKTFDILNHLHLLVMCAPKLFSSDYKHFYCQYNEPSYVKKLNLEMMAAVANESNTYEIMTEVCEYAANIDISMARESTRAMGKISLQQYVNVIVVRLLQILEMEKDYVTAETWVLVKDLLQKYPQWSHACNSVVGNISSNNV